MTGVNWVARFMLVRSQQLVSHDLRTLVTDRIQDPRGFAGRHIDDGHVTVRQAKRLVVDADRPFQLYADGDPIADLPAEVVVAPGALRMLVPTTAVPIAPRAVPQLQSFRRKTDKC